MKRRLGNEQGRCVCAALVNDADEVVAWGHVEVPLIGEVPQRSTSLPLQFVVEEIVKT